MKKTLFFTCADKKYEVFAILYPIFILESNKEAFVEIGVEDLVSFKEKYKHLIKFYNQNWPKKVLYREVNFFQKNIFGIKRKIPADNVRFISIPQTKAEYVYIGDIDILILEPILKKHLQNIKNNNLDFSNIVRHYNHKHLSGLHFINYEKMYKNQIEDLKKINVFQDSDEKLLYELMLIKKLKIPDLNIKYRPQHGIHISLHNRPPFNTLTTLDKKGDFPDWFNGACEEKDFTKIYWEKRYKGKIKKFMESIKFEDIELRRIVQLIDSVCYFKVNSNI